MKDLNEFNEICDTKTKPIYKKRYKENGEEYLEKVDEIDIEEDLKEKKLEIERIKELLAIQQRLKQEELLSESEDEETLTNLKNISENLQIEDTYDFMNKINEVKEFYNKMPKNVRMEYKDLTKFTKEYLPKYVNEHLEKIRKANEVEIKNQEEFITQNEKIENLQQQIKKIQEERSKIENV